MQRSCLLAAAALMRTTSWPAQQRCRSHVGGWCAGGHMVHQEGTACHNILGRQRSGRQAPSPLYARCPLCPSLQAPARTCVGIPAVDAAVAAAADQCVAIWVPGQRQGAPLCLGQHLHVLQGPACLHAEHTDAAIVAACRGGSDARVMVAATWQRAAEKSVQQDAAVQRWLQQQPRV